MTALPPPPAQGEEHFVSFRGSAFIGALVVKAPLARLRINSAMILVTATGFEDRALRSRGDYVQHFNNWYAFDALRVVEFSGAGGGILFNSLGAYANIEAVLRANGWDIYES